MIPIIAIAMGLGIVALLARGGPSRRRGASGGSPSHAARRAATRRAVSQVHDIMNESHHAAETSVPDSTGFSLDIDMAHSMAPLVSKMLAQLGPTHYDHEIIHKFQAFSGLRADGVYGPNTRAALVYFGVPNPPRPYSGRGQGNYVPPVAPGPSVSNA